MEYDDDQESQVPAVSAGHPRKRGSIKKKSSKRSGNIMLGGRGKKPKFRDMIVNAIKSYGEAKGSNFGKICRYIEKKHKLRNDFVVKHTLKWLLTKKILMNNGGRYKIIAPISPSAGRRRRKGGKRRGKSRRRRRKGGKKKGKGKRKGKRRRRRGGKRSKKRKGGKRRKRRRGGRRRKGRGRRGRRRSS